jgi:ubiquinone/menaquinone biosynthesis C-methylase UbiE
MDYDQTTMPAAYDAGRGYAPRVLEAWLRTIAAAVGDARIRDILDLGCGTGRYSAALARRFGARVVGVEPSEKMLAEAAKKAGDGVTLMRGSGEAVPLADASIDMVFISMVFHHFADPAKAAAQCHHVLRGGGVVCLRAGATDRIHDYPYVPFFPRTPAVLAVSLTSLAVIRSTFAAARFDLAHHEVVASEVAPSWAAYAEKTAYRADSILAQLTDPEFDAGLAALRRHAGAYPADEPVIEPVDFFVFRRPLAPPRRPGTRPSTSARRRSSGAAARCWCCTIRSPGWIFQAASSRTARPTSPQPCAARCARRPAWRSRSGRPSWPGSTLPTRSPRGRASWCCWSATAALTLAARCG